MGDFVVFRIFFRISGFEGFLYSVPPQGDPKKRPLNPQEDFSLTNPTRLGKIFVTFRAAFPEEGRRMSKISPNICPSKIPPQLHKLSAAFFAAYGFTGAFGRNLCKFTFPQRRRNLRKSLLETTRSTGVKRAKKWLR